MDKYEQLFNENKKELDKLINPLLDNKELLMSSGAEYYLFYLKQIEELKAKKVQQAMMVSSNIDEVVFYNEYYNNLILEEQIDYIGKISSLIHTKYDEKQKEDKKNIR